MTIQTEARRSLSATVPDIEALAVPTADEFARQRFCSALRRHAIPHFITGSFASSVHGEFRATADIDLVADIALSELPALMRDMNAAFVADAEQAAAALAAGMSFNLIHRTTYLKVDLFPCDNAFNRSALDRAVSITIPGAREHCASPAWRTSCSPSCAGSGWAGSRQRCNGAMCAN